MIYFVRYGDSDLVKIGFAENVKERLYGLQTSIPHRINLLATLPGPVALERKLHRIFWTSRFRGEWFRNRGDMPSLIALAASGDDSGAFALIDRMHSEAEARAAVRADKAQAFDAAAAAAIAQDIRDAADKYGREPLAEIMAVSISSVNTAARGSSTPTVLPLLRLLAHDPDALSRTFALIGCKVVEADVRALDRAGAIDCLGRVADMLRERRTAVRLESVA